MSNANDLGHLRKSYEKGALADGLKTESPLVLFEQWFAEADAHPAIEEANAMSIVTLGKDQFPMARVVLLKQFSLEGFVFYTNYMSEKGQAILAYPQVGVSFYWPALDVKSLWKEWRRLHQGFRRLLFFSPFRKSVGGYSLMQSEVIASREVLEAKLMALHEQYKGKPPQRLPIGVGFSAP